MVNGPMGQALMPGAFRCQARIVPLMDPQQGGAVASSRVYVKIHHPSDVIAGAILGVALARVARRVWPFPSVPE